ncbi:MAG: hypothetical protein QM613_00550, partial [Micrococcaceae bacterium]
SSSSGLVVVTNTVLTSTGISVDYSDDVKNFTITATLDGCDSVTAEQQWIYPNLMSWGANTSTYRLGNGTTTSSNTPGAIGPEYQIWRQLSAGTHSFALTESNKLWGWGSNGTYELADSTTTSAPRPKLITTSVGTDEWVTVATGKSDDGGYSLGVQTNGQLYAWGVNTTGQLGIGSLSTRAVPSVVGSSLSLNPWAATVGGHGHSLGVTEANKLYGWGLNTNGSVGDGTNTTPRTNPRAVSASYDWAQITAGHSCSAGILTDGSLYSWGLNDLGQLGLGNTTNKNSPQRVGSSLGVSWMQVSMQYWHALALTTDGALYAWGNNSKGQIGDNTTTNRTSPISITVSDVTSWQYVSAGAGSSGVSHSLAIAENGDLYAWGNNSSGQLGDGTNVNKLVPTKIGNMKWDTVAGGGLFSVGVARTFVPKGYSY